MIQSPQGATNESCATRLLRNFANLLQTYVRFLFLPLALLYATIAAAPLSRGALFPLQFQRMLLTGYPKTATLRQVTALRPAGRETAPGFCMVRSEGRQSRLLLRGCVASM